MRTRTFGIILAVCAILSFTQPSLATVLAVWDFGVSSDFYTESPAYYNTATAPGFLMTGGDKDTNGKNGIAYIDAGGIAHDPGQAAAWEDVNKSGTTNDAALTLTLNTTGFSSLAIRWDYKSELATSFDFSYRTAADGEWVKLLNNSPITPITVGSGFDVGNWYSTTIDMSAITALNNQSYVQFLIDDWDEGPGDKKLALDNLEIKGVPEPTTLLLLGLGAMLLKKTKYS